MNRRLQREHVFKIIFSYEFDIKEDFAQHMEYYLEDIEPDNAESIDYIREKALKIVGLIDEIDLRINEKTKDWTTERIAKVEVAIIRLAVYEVYYDDEVPNSVAINEAIEIAKKFGGESSPSFVNGVLANIVN
ncbi:MAG: transcription antitermination factor NusB [Firmicutes bacterium HGW-Firmicutes-1]|nr:MAG: transcription antitermination factor NusB [Firmicutes bacterium HGW-Firmicutes-1]